MISKLFGELPLEEQTRLVRKAEKLVNKGVDWNDFVDRLDVDVDMAKDIARYMKRTGTRRIEARLFYV